MVIERNELINEKHVELDFDFLPTDEQKKSISSLIEFKYAKVSVCADYVSNLAIININIKGKMVLASTRSLKPVDFPFKEEDTLTISFFKNNDEEEDEENSIIYCEEDEIDLDQIIMSMIITAIPIKVVGKNEPECFYGDSWEVISEEEYNKKKAKEKDSRFSELDSFFDDEN